MNTNSREPWSEFYRNSARRPPKPGGWPIALERSRKSSAMLAAVLWTAEISLCR